MPYFLDSDWCVNPPFAASNNRRSRYPALPHPCDAAIAAPTPACSASTRSPRSLAWNSARYLPTSCHNPASRPHSRLAKGSQCRAAYSPTAAKWSSSGSHSSRVFGGGSVCAYAVIGHNASRPPCDQCMVFVWIVKRNLMVFACSRAIDNTIDSGFRKASPNGRTKP